MAQRVAFDAPSIDARAVGAVGSSTVAEPGNTRINACSALMPGCLMRNVATAAAPDQVLFGLSGNSTIVLSGCNQKAFSMVLRYFLSAGFLRNFATTGQRSADPPPAR